MRLPSLVLDPDSRQEAPGLGTTQEIRGSAWIMGSFGVSLEKAKWTRGCEDVWKFMWKYEIEEDGGGGGDHAGTIARSTGARIL